MTLRSEILEQPAVAERFIATQAEPVAAIGAALRARGFRHVVIAGRGTSDHAAIYAQYVLGVRNGLAVGLATPSVISLYGGEPDVRDALVIGISQSGESPDIAAVVTAARAQGAPTIAITNEPASPLARAAEWTIHLGAGPERAIAATKTYTTELLAVALLSASLNGPGGGASAGSAASSDLGEVRTIPDTLAQVLASEDDIRRIAAEQADDSRALVVARGFEYATAREWALKLKELAHVFADPYSAADVRHGPLALVEPGVPVLALVRSGVAAADVVALLERLRDQLGAQSMVVSDDPAALELATWGVPLPAGTPEWLGPIVSIVPGQLHAMHLTLARGLDPEQPRHISKVTRTT